jgi:aryl-alcohol dehydrogenase-like predicted oxidoreductase
MRYKSFGRSCPDVSVVGVGTWAIGGDHWGEVNDSDSINAIRAMLANGVNLIDTAPGYNWGYSEKIVGRAVRGLRDKVLISTKGGIVPPDFGRNSTREYLFGDLERSLVNLQTDYIDFYFVHWPDENTPFEITMRALEDMRKAGKIRFIGVSNFTQQQMEDASKYGVINVMQPPYSMVNRTQEQLLQWAIGIGIATMTYGSLGAGILTGVHRKLPDFKADDWRMAFYDNFKEPKFSKIMLLLKEMDLLAAKYNGSLSQVAINWSTQKNFVSTALIGVRNVQEANENCGGMGWMLTDSEIKHLDKKIDEFLA